MARARVSALGEEMGISYSAVKLTSPYAWEIGKDYYGLSDLFPPCAYSNGFFRSFFTPKLSDLPMIVGSRHMICPTPFRVTDHYPTCEEMLNKMVGLKARPLDVETKEMFEAFYEWAGSDEIQLISEFDYLAEREAESEYILCAPPHEYHHMDSWNGEPGRRVGYEIEGYDDNDYTNDCWGGPR